MRRGIRWLSLSIVWAQVPFAVEKLDRLVFIAVALRPFRPLRPVRPTVSTGKPVVQTVLSTVSLLWHSCRKRQ